jgi:Domain of unknown function (DUF4124)
MRATAPGIVLIGLAVASLLLCATAGADATLYRWVDKDGHVHYGDQATANAKPVNPNLLNNGEDASAASSSGASTASSSPNTAKQAADCKSKSDELIRYQGASTITETDALGNSREYTAEQKNQLIAKTQKYINENCSGAPPAAY